MVKRAACLTAAFLLAMAVHAQSGYSQPAADEYAGVETCAGCHEELVAGWKTTRHAKAFATLQKKHQETLGHCLKCHVTGFEKEGGFMDGELTPHLAGVQCEVCHGAAAAHAANPDSKKGLVARPGEDTCRECHTKGQDPKFDFHNKKLLVHGAAKKGGK
ncbi:cytochrome C554 [Geobacter sp. FeAm09]|uniref:cytochrome c family protein n=1 Tax=Geobacter sp. FeAm09 TaxID=2597769 RepID=UPI0011ECA52D|nr:cytochrome c family protein [Geobacter sp. FeAm09]QEM69482.1 cytochrome C554 [Geobacter sp. FeAm09]